MSKEKPDDIHVRIAVLEDLDAVMDLCRLGHSENGMHDMNMMKLLQQVYPALLRDGAICGVIGPVGGPLTGIILLRIATAWYSDSKHLEELGVFTHPDFRDARGGRASKLCAFSKQAADMLGLPLQIGVFSTNRVEAKVRLYERHFGPPAGAYWLYGVKTGDTTPTHVKD